MFYKNVLVVLGVCCCLCLASTSDVSDEEQSSDLECGQFENDLDVLRHFPFPIRILSKDKKSFPDSSAYLNEDGITIGKINIWRETIVPPYVFCLSNLSNLFVEGTPFPNDVVPKDLGKLKTLRLLIIINTPIKKLPIQLSSMTNLGLIQFWNCSLTYLPDLTNLRKLVILVVEDNQISHIDALPPLELLYLTNNRFTQVPTLEDPERLEALSLSHNPWMNIQSILLCKNLELLSLADISLTSIPHEIDQLQKLKYLDLSPNQLTDIPEGIINLPQLRILNLTGNLFSPDDIKSVQIAWQTSRPDVELIV